MRVDVSVPEPALGAEESRRLAALQALQVLDSDPEDAFDALVRSAALVCGTPIALISLVDAERQWFKAGLGLGDVRQTPREQAFCAHAIARDAVMEVSDARADLRFADNPLVTGEPGIRFYAGAPLQLACGARVGTLCVIDREPRILDTAQREVLRHLARGAALALESRRALLQERQRHLREIQAVRELAQSEARFRALSEQAPLGVYEADAGGACTWANARARAIFELTLNQGRGDGWVQALHPQDRSRVHAAWRQAAQAGRAFDETFRLQSAAAGVRRVRSRAAPLCDAGGRVTGYVGTLEDLTDERVAGAPPGDRPTGLRLS